MTFEYVWEGLIHEFVDFPFFLYVRATYELV